MITLYQLVAKGNKGAIEGLGVIYSRRVFTSKERAELYIPTFVVSATTPMNNYDMVYLEKEGLEVKIVELELVREPEVVIRDVLREAKKCIL